MPRRLLVLCVLATLASAGAVLGCQPAASTTDDDERELGEVSSGDEETDAPPAAVELGEPQPRPERWPQVLVAGPPEAGAEPQPALYLGPGDGAPPVGYLDPGALLRVESAPLNDRVQVLVGGALSTKGWIPRRRLAAYAQARGRVEGSRGYVGPNDYVTVLGPAEDEDLLEVEVRPWLGGNRYLPALRGTYPAERLGPRRVDEGTVEGPSEGECVTGAPGQSVVVYERPGGEAVSTIPGATPPHSFVRLRQRGEWSGVRVGYGPYVVGYVRGELTPCAGPRPAPQPHVPSSAGEVPRWMTLEEGTLHRVAARTPVYFQEEIIARLRQRGWALELDRSEELEGMVDVFLTVDDQVAIRGLVRADALSPVAAPE